MFDPVGRNSTGSRSSRVRRMTIANVLAIDRTMEIDASNSTSRIIDENGWGQACASGGELDPNVLYPSRHPDRWTA